MRPCPSVRRAAPAQTAGAGVVVPRSRPAAASRPGAPATARRHAWLAEKAVPNSSATGGWSFRRAPVPTSCATSILNCSADDPVWGPRATALAARTFELTEYLARFAPDLPGGCRRRTASPIPIPGACVASASSSNPRPDWRASEPRRRRWRTVSVAVSAAPSRSISPTSRRRIVDRKCESIAAVGADAVVGGDLGCLLNIEGAASGGRAMNRRACCILLKCWPAGATLERKTESTGLFDRAAPTRRRCAHAPGGGESAIRSCRKPAKAKPLFVGKRAKGVAGLADDGLDFELLRSTAESIRNRVLSRPRRLARFFGREGAGHRRRGCCGRVMATEWLRLVVDIARRHGVTKAIKSKSMLSGRSSTGAGRSRHSPVETDLGEYIIQLAGEPPSHIIAPAVPQEPLAKSGAVRRGHGRPEQPAEPQRTSPAMTQEPAPCCVSISSVPRWAFPAPTS